MALLELESESSLGELVNVALLVLRAICLNVGHEVAQTATLHPSSVVCKFADKDCLRWVLSSKHRLLHLFIILLDKHLCFKTHVLLFMLA